MPQRGNATVAAWNEAHIFDWLSWLYGALGVIQTEVSESQQ